ncbi:MAG: hypothetical protein AAFZ15_02135 [Bacteroidota bacterium]
MKTVIQKSLSEFQKNEIQTPFLNAIKGGGDGDTIITEDTLVG